MFYYYLLDRDLNAGRLLKIQKTKEFVNVPNIPRVINIIICRIIMRVFSEASEFQRGSGTARNEKICVAG